MKAVDGDRKLYAKFRYADGTIYKRSPFRQWSGEVVTSCVIYDDMDFLVAVGESRKSERDQFSRKRGREIALGRAVHSLYPDNAEKRHVLLKQFLSSIRPRSDK